MLQWPQYNLLKDTAEVLLAESVETYDFIEKVTSFAPPCFPRQSCSDLKAISADDTGYFDTSAIEKDTYRHGRSARCERGTLPPIFWVQGLD